MRIQWCAEKPWTARFCMPYTMQVVSGLVCKTARRETSKDSKAQQKRGGPLLSNLRGCDKRVLGA